MKKKFYSVIVRKLSINNPLIIGIIVISIGGVFLYFMSQNDSTYVQRKIILEKNALSILLKTAHFIEQRYQQGDFEKHFISGYKKCDSSIGNKDLLSITYLQYNWQYVECFLEPWKIQSQLRYPIVFNKKKFYTNIEKISDKIIPLREGINLELRLKEFPDKSLIIHLSNITKMLILPTGVYEYPINNKNTEQIYYWDNLDKKILIDPMPVSWLDINNWNKKLVPPYVIRENLWPKAATHLTKEQMDQYCHDRQSQILSSHIFYAAFAPKNIIKPRQKVSIPDYKNFLIPTISWMGLQKGDSNIKEYVVNIFDKNANIYNKNSQLFQVLENIDNNDFSSLISFRCMKILLTEEK